MQNDRPEHSPLLSLIMPSFNEIATIQQVINSWVEEFEGLSIDYEMRIYDAASTDGTVEAVRQIAQENPRVILIVEPGLPHGASCLQGYKEARGQWVFQIDSDDEMKPASFSRLWEERENYDILLGCRQDRVSPLPRRIVTAASRLSVAILFGGGLRDVNTPYRLMRKQALEEIISAMPEDTLAPNVIICGLMRKRDKRIFQCDVPHDGRVEGTAGLVKWRLVKIAAQSFAQTLRAALRPSPSN